MISSESATTLVWGHSALELVVDVSPDGPVGVRALTSGPSPADHPRSAQPLVELLVAGEGRSRPSHRFSETELGRRLVHAGSARTRDGKWSELHVDTRDERTGLVARTSFRSVDGVAACQVRTVVTNRGAAPVLLQGVTSFAAGFPGARVEDVDLLRGESEWLGEGRWARHPLRDGVTPDLGLGLHGQDGKGRFAAVSTGTWSTGAHLPTGGLVDRVDGQAWLWQVEHNGAWRWEVGERLGGAYVALLGPTDVDHQWLHRLLPGESFTTVPVSVAVSASGVDGAVAAMTAHRRELVRPHPDRTALPVVFNDYMNTLMGDPTTAKLLPLVDAAADAGAEVFCIDAGWYDNDANWWDSVGEWRPSETRFPGGIAEVLTRIRDRGMVPGLWLEPEVIGVRSPMADELPAAAFLQRDGVRLVESGRYLLDLRHPSAVAHLDGVVDRLVGDLGVGYFKLDYNVDPGAGTDFAADSAGAGLLAHNRAHLRWLDGVLDRHPGLILENCGSGAMRMDYALLSRMQLQSTSDQQDPLRYPPIAVAAPMSVLPEQSASWAYPQPDMADELFAFTLCTGMLGRLYLSGRLDLMDDDRLRSVREAVEVHRAIRADLAAAVPVWPLGLPAWSDPWLGLGMVSGDVTHLAVWRRDGAGADVALSLPHLRGRPVDVEVLYPRDLPAWTHSWDEGNGTLTLAPTRHDTASARLFRITASAAGPAPAAETLRVELGSPTGAFHGGATGMLYGLGDPGVPSHDLIAGMRPRTVSQKPPGGEQHPGGDALRVADGFFAAGGTEVHVYAQDVYSAWPYQDLGIDDYIARLRPRLEEVAARPDRDRFVWTIFNEPDMIWYEDWAARKDRFLADWTRVHRLVRSVLPDARIAGPGETRYRPDHLRDLLAHAEAHDVLPDVVTWHELGPDSLTTYREHYEDYRRLERELGIAPRPINVNEYSNRRDTSVPGQLVQWIAMLEETKVDGQMAFWTMAGNLSDHAVRAGRANGGWWLAKWYADLSGDTVRVTPPRPSTRDTLQGLAAFDRDDAKATVLLGGTANAVDVAVTGLDRRVFGDHVDVRVSKTTWSGYEGDAGQPPVVHAARVQVVDGEAAVPVPGGDPLAAYQVVITPAGPGAPPAADAPWQASYEAESGTVEHAVVVTRDDGSGSPDMAQRYTTSGGKDVGSMEDPRSRVTVDVDVPRDGAYRLGVFYGTDGFVGRQALYVDDAHVGDLTFPATLNRVYRGRLDTTITLTAGRHRVSLRTSGPDGFLGAPSDLALDRFDLTEVTGPERAVHPLTESRRSGGEVDRGALALQVGAPAAVVLRPGDAVTTYVSAAEDGYYALSTSLACAGRSALGLALSGRRVPDLAAERPGAWTGRVTAHLKAGVTEVVLSNEGGTPLALGALTSVRDAASDRHAVRVEAEAGRIEGGAVVVPGRWASGGSYVGSLGDGGTLTIPRPAGLRSGRYNLTVAYAQAEKNTGHPYNTDTVTRTLVVTEEGGHATSAPYRHNYTWDGFWPETSPLDLVTDDGSLTFGNPAGRGPNVDWVQLAPLVVASSVEPRR